jgi:hypothetical protein
VPSGSYLLSGHDGPYAVERFTCSETHHGWRYVGSRVHPITDAAVGRIELLVDAGGRVLRLEVAVGGWMLRGGVVGPEALWRRGYEERSAAAHGFTGSSPSYAVVACRLAASREQLRLVAVHDSSLATSTVDQAWTAAGGGGWDSTDLATGERGRWRVEDGVVVTGPGLTLTAS